MNYQLHLTWMYFLNIFDIISNLQENVLKGIHYAIFCFKNENANLGSIRILHWWKSVMIFFDNF